MNAYRINITEEKFDGTVISERAVECKDKQGFSENLNKEFNKDPKALHLHRITSQIIDELGNISERILEGIVFGDDLVTDYKPLL